MIDFQKRIRSLRDYMDDANIDLCFLPKSSEQEYLTGMPKGRYKHLPISSMQLQPAGFS